MSSLNDDVFTYAHYIYKSVDVIVSKLNLQYCLSFLICEEA